MNASHSCLLPPKVSHRRTTAALAMILVALAVSDGFASPAQRSANSVTIAGMTPGGRVAWVSVSREPQRWYERVVPRVGITVANESGVAAFTTAVPISAKSIWIAVDLENGDFARTEDALTARPAVELREALGLLVSSGRARVTGGTEEILVVRPGVGAWTGRTGDGWKDDEDGAVNGELTLTTASLQPLGGKGPGFSGFEPNDVVAVIDHDRMEAVVIRTGAR